MSTARLDAMSASMTGIIEEFHAGNPLADGIPKQELMSRLKERWHIEDDKLLSALISYYIETGLISDKGKSIALSGHKVELSADQKALQSKIAAMYETADIELIRNDDVYALSKDRNEIAALLSDLVDNGVIVKVDAEYFASKVAWDKAVDAAFRLGENFTLAEYRDELDTSRKYASIFLNSFDRAGVTMFVGETRTAVARR